MDEEFLLTEQCTVKGTLYYNKDHVIKVINNNSLMQEIIDAINHCGYVGSDSVEYKGKGYNLDKIFGYISGCGYELRIKIDKPETYIVEERQLTPEETLAIPSLPTKADDAMATKFQIILRGDVAKPLSLVKSFKWLALASEIEQAQNFVSTLPDPSIVADPENATIEAIMQAQELKAKEDAKLINKVKRFFNDEKE